MSAQSPMHNFHHELLSLQRIGDIEARLGLLGPNDKATIFDKTEVVDVRIIAGDSSIPGHYVIRPIGCTQERIAKEPDIFQLLPPQDGKPVTIDLATIGGHYGVGVQISINDKIVTLPAIKMPRDLASRETPKFELPIEELPPRPSAWAPDHAIVINDYDSSGATEVRSDSLLNGSISMFTGIGTCADHEDLIAYTKKGENVSNIFLLDGNLYRADIAISIVAQHLINATTAGLSLGEAFNTATAELKTAIERDCPGIRSYVEQRFGTSTYLGTCALGAEISGNTLTGHLIGDSKMIVLRPLPDGTIHELCYSMGDNLAEQLEYKRDIEGKEISQAAINQSRHIITKNIGYPSMHGDEVAPRVLGPFELQKGDLVILETDGMFVLPKEELYRICQEKKNGPEIMAECYCRMNEIVASQQKKGYDNYSMIIYQHNPAD